MVIHWTALKLGDDEFNAQTACAGSQHVNENVTNAIAAGLTREEKLLILLEVKCPTR
jgi:hypothetical protein